MTVSDFVREYWAYGYVIGALGTGAWFWHDIPWVREVAEKQVSVPVPPRAITVSLYVLLIGIMILWPIPLAMQLGSLARHKYEDIRYRMHIRDGGCDECGEDRPDKRLDGEHEGTNGERDRETPRD